MQTYAMCYICDKGAVCCVLQVIRLQSSMQKGFGFVTYTHLDAAQAAMAALNGTRLPGAFGNRALKVTPSFRGEGMWPPQSGPRPPASAPAPAPA
jgi:RNA recognition motif-containing protein